MNDFLYAIIQGIVQGLTEFLPISSSGHLEFFRYVFGGEAENHLLFAVLLHLGTLAAVVLVYRKTLAGMIKEIPALCSDLAAGRFRADRMSSRRRTLLMVMAACLPLPAVLIFAKIGDKLNELAQGSLIVTGFCFMISGVLMFLAAGATKKQEGTRIVTLKIALIIGFAQAFAGGFSGISRSGTTVAVALLLGLHKETAVNFSFLIGIPAILAAAAYEVLSLLSDGGSSSLNPAAMILGILIAAAVGIFAIAALRFLVRKNRFHWFGIYCFAIGIVSLVVSAVRLA